MPVLRLPRGVRTAGNTAFAAHAHRAGKGWAHHAGFLGIALLTIAALAAPTPARAAGAAAPAAVGTPVVGFDAVTTQAERNGWKHLGLRRDRYVIFNDATLFESGFIRDKWRFLPARFTTGVDAASVVMVDRRWQYTFVEGNEAVVFYDSGIVSGPAPYTSLWPFLPAAFGNGLDAVTHHHENGQDVRLVTAGENYAFFRGSVLLDSGRISGRWPYLPAQFHANLDDASVEYQDGGWKISFYKDNERIVFQDNTGQVNEQAISTVKWWFMRDFLIA